MFKKPKLLPPIRTYGEDYIWEADLMFFTHPTIAKENVRRKGADPILWGRWETEEEWEECEENENEKSTMGSSKEGGAQESKMRRKPPTSSKQLRKLGEPTKKMGRIEEDSARDADIP